IGVNGFKNIGGNIKQFISLRYGQVEKSILQKCPYIKHATVKYLPPNKIMIQVEERTPVALIPYIGAFLLVDREGYILDTATGDEGILLPKIKGLNFTSYQIGQALNIENRDKFDELIILVDTLTQEDKNDNFKIVEKINTIDISDSNNLYLFIDSRIIVNLGSLDDLNYKIRSLHQIFFKNIGEGEKGFSDYTAGDYPVFIPGGG
ncbi:MAG TPA: FtsQ-type POTRA domain-containing protein, partial [Clostridiales bacterium]|nr:FtsQ-type POTRA domain-containing protein [Clostridiales bacterium]